MFNFLNPECDTAEYWHSRAGQSAEGIFGNAQETLVDHSHWSYCHKFSLIS